MDKFINKNNSKRSFTEIIDKMEPFDKLQKKTQKLVLDLNGKSIKKRNNSNENNKNFINEDKNYLTKLKRALNYIKNTKSRGCQREENSQKINEN